MSRTLTAVLLVLALAPAALAQPTVDSGTGLNPVPAGIGKDQLFDYLRAVESATTTIVWDTSGDSRKEFGANRMVFDLKWAWDERRGEPVVVGGEVGRHQAFEDLLAAAVNDAVHKVEKENQAAMQEMTAGLNLPPGFKLPF